MDINADLSKDSQARGTRFIIVYQIIATGYTGKVAFKEPNYIYSWNGMQ